MALKLVRIPKGPKPSKQQKSREEYLVACLREEANVPKFTDWEKNFIMSLKGNPSETLEERIGNSTRG